MDGLDGLDLLLAPLCGANNKTFSLFNNNMPNMPSKIISNEFQHYNILLFFFNIDLLHMILTEGKKLRKPLSLESGQTYNKIRR